MAGAVLMIARRGFLTGIIAACMAPAIVRAGLIMPIKPALVIATEMPTDDLVEVVIGSDRIGSDWVHVNGESLMVVRKLPTLIPRRFFDALRNSNLEMTWRDSNEMGSQARDHVMKRAIEAMNFGPRGSAIMRPENFGTPTTAAVRPFDPYRDIKRG